MPRIVPVPWKTLECIIKRLGFVFDRHQGTSHRVYVKPGHRRPFPVPAKKQVSKGIILNLIRESGISRDEYFHLLEECK